MLILHIYPIANRTENTRNFNDTIYVTMFHAKLCVIKYIEGSINMIGF